jgi:hypothetical protein
MVVPTSISPPILSRSVVEETKISPFEAKSVTPACPLFRRNAWRRQFTKLGKFHQKAVTVEKTERV